MSGCSCLHPETDSEDEYNRDSPEKEPNEEVANKVDGDVILTAAVAGAAYRAQNNRDREKERQKIRERVKRQDREKQKERERNAEKEKERRRQRERQRHAEKQRQASKSRQKQAEKQRHKKKKIGILLI